MGVPESRRPSSARVLRLRSLGVQIVIAGGGTAGWMTAAYLEKALDASCNIVVVESPSIRTIGVGEATFSTIKLFFDWLDLDESEWMPACNATYKMAIKFVNWTAFPGHFYPPFQRYDVVDGINLGEWWLKLKSGSEPFDYACFTVPELCDRQRSPRYLDGRVFDDQVQSAYGAEHRARKGVLADHLLQYPYAYHFDARLLADFLKGWATRRGVRQVLDDIVEVRLAENGDLAELVTRDHGAIGGDLFVDCTGFRGLLINQALGEPFVPFSRSLLCDGAIAMQVPVDVAAAGIDPFTTATALDSGWVWRIPLYGRVGTGYVYSSAFATADEAEAELRRHLGPAAADCNASRIKMRIGRCRNSWVRNCVAIGLASGFVEPLESTGIFFIQHGIEELLSHLHAPADEESDELVKSYNRRIAECIDGVMEFLTLRHALLARHRDRHRGARRARRAAPALAAAAAEPPQHQPPLPRVRVLFLLGHAAGPERSARGQPAGARSAEPGPGPRGVRGGAQPHRAPGRQPALALRLPHPRPRRRQGRPAPRLRAGDDRTLGHRGHRLRDSPRSPWGISRIFRLSPAVDSGGCAGPRESHPQGN